MTVAIIAAGGRGARLGATLPKQFLELSGRTVLQRSVDAFASSGLVDEVIVVLPPALVGTAIRTVAGAAPVRVVPGGERRQDSVAAGFDALAPGTEIVLVHDAARPFVSRGVIAATIDAAREHGAAIAAVRARDTVKRAAEEGGRRVIADTIPREEVFLAQTPQAFRFDVLADAVELGRAGLETTDEAALAERAGHRVTLVEGDVWNFKITTAGDWDVARLMAAADRPGGAGDVESPAQLAEAHAHGGGASAARTARAGLGYDLHRLVEGRPLVLGGVTIPSERGLLGHSDADAIAHAVTDAVLGAAALGDIGRLFPDTDARWKGADSLMMLEAAVVAVREAGYAVANVDVVVIAERPKIGPYRDAIRTRLAQVLDVPVAAVSVKGKTNEGVDATGRREAIAVHAVAMVVPRSWEKG